MGWWTDTLNSPITKGVALATTGPLGFMTVNAATKTNRRKVGNVVDDITGENQAIAARDAAKTQNQAALESNAMLDKWHQQGREDMAPWLAAGKENLGTLQGLMRQGAFDMPDEQFDASQYAMPGAFDPNSVNVEQDPGYKFRMEQGQKGLMRGAAKMGGFASGATLAGLMQHGQEMGSQEYGNAYNRAADTYGMNYDRAAGERQFGYGNFLDSYQRRAGNRQDRFGRLSQLAGTGQAASSTLAGMGQNFAQNYGQNRQAGANSMAAGKIGAANASSQFYNNLLNLGGQAGAAFLGGR